MFFFKLAGLTCLVVVIFHACVHLVFKHAVLDPLLGYLDCWSGENEEAVVALHLPNEP